MKSVWRCLGIAMVGWLTTTAEAHAQQPFSNTSQSPTVSPYLNLTNRSNIGQPTYQTLVRPVIEQREENFRQQQQISRLQRGQKSLVANTQRGLAQRGISNDIRGTGHTTVFMDTAHYFPRPQPR